MPGQMARKVIEDARPGRTTRWHRRLLEAAHEQVKREEDAIRLDLRARELVIATPGQSILGVDLTASAATVTTNVDVYRTALFGFAVIVYLVWRFIAPLVGRLMSTADHGAPTAGGCGGGRRPAGRRSKNHAKNWKTFQSGSAAEMLWKRARTGARHALFFFKNN